MLTESTPIRQPDEEALNAEAIAYCRQLDNLPLADVLDSLSETIAAMSPIAEDARIPHASANLRADLEWPGPPPGKPLFSACI